MSLSLRARPFGLLTDLIDIVQDVAAEDRIANNNFNAMNERVRKLMSQEYESDEEMKAAAQEIIQNAAELLTKEYETVFADRNLLIKTLEEHGVENIQVNGESIFGKYGAFRIDCYRDEKSVYAGVEQNPYTLKITAECTEEEINELINDINIEYTANTQEETYIKIKERLEKQGLRIDDEEVYEDDTIVLTVNLD